MSDQLMLRVDALADVLAWKARNPDAWRFVVDLAHQDRARGITPSTRYYCCVLRRPEHARRLGLERGDAPVLVNDHLSSGMARLLNRLYPDLRCPTRDAKVDRWERAS